MLDENLIATLEQSLRQTRNAQNRLIAQLREKESEVEHLRAVTEVVRIREVFADIPIARRGGEGDGRAGGAGDV